MYSKSERSADDTRCSLHFNNHLRTIIMNTNLINGNYATSKSIRPVLPSLEEMRKVLSDYNHKHSYRHLSVSELVFRDLLDLHHLCSQFVSMDEPGRITDILMELLHYRLFPAQCAKQDGSLNDEVNDEVTHEHKEISDIMFNVQMLISLITNIYNSVQGIQLLSERAASQQLCTV